jgi:hypothetical protein
MLLSWFMGTLDSSILHHLPITGAIRQLLLAYACYLCAHHTVMGTAGSALTATRLLCYFFHLSAFQNAVLFTANTNDPLFLPPSGFLWPSLQVHTWTKFLSASQFAWLILWTWRQKQYIPLKQRWTSTGLHSVTTLEMGLFVVPTVRRSHSLTQFWHINNSKKCWKEGKHILQHKLMLHFHFTNK